MRFFDRFRKQTTPHSESTRTPPASAGAPPPRSADTPSQYSREVVAGVAATWVMGMSHFEGNSLQQGLAQMFCGAVSERLLDEVEGITRTSSEVLRDLGQKVSAPPAAIQAFSSMSPADFDDTYKRLRVEYVKHGTDLEELARALLSVQAIVKRLSHTPNAPNILT